MTGIFGPLIKSFPPKFYPRTRGLSWPMPMMPRSFAWAERKELARRGAKSIIQKFARHAARRAHASRDPGVARFHLELFRHLTLRARAAAIISSAMSLASSTSKSIGISASPAADENSHHALICWANLQISFNVFFSVDTHKYAFRSLVGVRGF